MTLDEYQKRASEFASYHDNAVYPELGLAEEAGEVCGKVAKFVRRWGRHPYAHARPAYTLRELRERLEHAREYKDVDVDVDVKFIVDVSAEIGDTLWMLSEIATQYGLRLDDIAGENIAKLEDRRARGVIDGNGDNR